MQENIYPPYRPVPKPLMVDTLYQLARERQTYANLLYLLETFPLGVTYFALVIVGVVTSVLDTAIIGLPFTVLFLWVFWQLAIFERTRATYHLGVIISPMITRPFPPNSGWVQRLQIHLARPVVWKSLLYLFLIFPYSVLAFCLVLLVPILILTLGLATFIVGFFISPFILLGFTLFGSGSSKVTKRHILHALTGFGFVFSLFYITNSLASVWGQFARAMLGVNENQLRLAQATAQAEEANRRAEVAERKRRDLIINVSHELRTPVASIRGHIESLLIACDESEQAQPSPETLRKYLHIVHRESIRLGTLVDDLLSVARAERNELRVTLNPVDAGEIVEEVYQTLMPLAKRERQIIMIRDIAANLPRVQADRQRLTQVLLNLARNAITYTPDGGIVALKLSQVDPDHLALTVSDTGIGIPPEDRERIFERFYRTDASRSRSSGGSGLGLAIVRDFVIAMGGSISVASAPGEGSCFTVLFGTENK